MRDIWWLSLEIMWQQISSKLYFFYLSIVRSSYHKCPNLSGGKKISKFKPAVLRLKIYVVSHPAHGRGIKYIHQFTCNHILERPPYYSFFFFLYSKSCNILILFFLLFLKSCSQANSWCFSSVSFYVMLGGLQRGQGTLTSCFFCLFVCFFAFLFSRYKLLLLLFICLFIFNFYSLNFHLVGVTYVINAVKIF